MHTWYDDWKHWDKLYEAQNFIVKYVGRRTGCYLMSKEKWGSLRYEWIIPPKGHVCQLVYVIKAPWKKTFKWDDYEESYHPILFAWNECWLYYKWQNFGWWMTKRAVLKAIQKWPCIADELMSDLASHERLMGKEIHDQYWTKVGD